MKIAHSKNISSENTVVVYKKTSLKLYNVIKVF